MPPRNAASKSTTAKPRLPPAQYSAEQFSKFENTTSLLLQALESGEVRAALDVVEAFRERELAPFKKQQVIYGAEVLMDALPIARQDLLAAELAVLVLDPSRLPDLAPAVLCRVLEVP